MTGRPPFSAFHLAIAELDPEPLPPSAVVAGRPQVSGKVLWRSADGSSSEGIWQITPGVVVDIEADESFVVVFGRATIESIDDPDHPPLEVGTGDHVTLRAGTRTRWTVHETLRKVYLVRS